MPSLTLLLAYASVAYLIASATYLIVSARWPSPFMDAVRKQPKLVEIYDSSRSERSMLFSGSFMAAAVLLLLWRPL